MTASTLWAGGNVVVIVEFCCTGAEGILDIEVVVATITLEEASGDVPVTVTMVELRLSEVMGLTELTCDELRLVPKLWRGTTGVDAALGRLLLEVIPFEDAESGP